MNTILIYYNLNSFLDEDFERMYRRLQYKHITMRVLCGLMAMQSLLAPFCKVPLTCDVVVCLFSQFFFLATNFSLLR